MKLLLVIFLSISVALFAGTMGYARAKKRAMNSPFTFACLVFSVVGFLEIVFIKVLYWLGLYTGQ